MTDWTHELAMAGSEVRASVLVRALDAHDDVEEKRELLRKWFNVCEAIGPWRHELRRQFDLAGWVTDTDDVPEFPCTIYRAAWEDDDVETALSWTTGLEWAQNFARGLSSLRAMFLGYYRDDVEAWIWEGRCIVASAYFNGRGEHEVIPKMLWHPHPIQKLVPVPKEVAGVEGA